MKILFLASEVVPFSKTGGLADVAGALPSALAALGHDVLVATPLYSAVDQRGLEPVERSLTLRFPFGPESARFLVHQASAHHRVLFVANDHYFARPGFYGDSRGDYPDNHRRFGFFGMAALAGAQLLDFAPDIVHLNDWQTGLAAVALRHGFRGTPLGNARSVFTIHNLAYQGTFPKRVMEDLGLPWELFRPEGLEFYDQVSFLKAGLAYSDALTTVSPRYAEEIQTPDAGWGLDGFLRARAGDLHGILNGVDVGEWDPARDPHLPAPYDADHLDAKAQSKAEVLKRYGLNPDTRAPLYGMVSRIVSQKGFDILLPALFDFFDRHDARLVLLGTGDPRYVEGLNALARRFPDKVSVRIGYDVGLSHLIEAGSDFFLMPSQFEPCGLNQMYSLLYGTVPIVRAVGGLDDTVRDAFADPERGNGIKFVPFTPEEMMAALQRSLALYADGQRLRKVRQQGMRADLSWNRSAREYESLFQSLVAGNEFTGTEKAQ